MSPLLGGIKGGWVYLENRYGERFATFISRKDLRDGFRKWRHKIKIKKLVGVSREAVSRAMLEVLTIGKFVYHRSTKIKGRVIFKGFNTVGKAIAQISWRDGVSKERAIDLEPC